MRDHDEFALIFRLWSDLLVGITGFLVGIIQYFVGASLLVIVLSGTLGIAASEIAYRLGRDETRTSLRRCRALGPIVPFCSALAITAGAVFFCHRSGLEIAGGAVVLVMAIVIAGDFIGGQAAAVGVIIAGVSSTLYWLIPPNNSFAITDGRGFAQFVVVSVACLSTVAMLKTARRLNR